MIKDIWIHNFRPHDNLRLKDLHPNLNVFIGETGTGKTSIFRALRLLFSNEPSGGAKLYRFKENAKLIIKTLVDDVVITREAKKYTIKKIDIKKPIELTSFGKDVPQSIKNILNLQDINWQLQIQPHFLVLENGGTAAKYLNPILGSEESELILTKLKEKSSKLRGEFKLQNSIIKDNKIFLNKFKNIGEFQKRIKKIQSHILHLQANQKHVFSLEKKRNEILEIDSKIINQIKLKRFKNKINVIESKVAEIYHLDLDINRLEKHLKKLKELETKPVKKYLIEIKNIEEMIKEKNSLQEDIDNIQSFFKAFKNIEEALEVGLIAYDKAKDKWNKEFDKLSICPLCNQRIKDAKDHTHNRPTYKWKKSNLQIR